jgi:NitT/TauT family transport system ATP-binding protein
MKLLNTIIEINGVKVVFGKRGYEFVAIEDLSLSIEEFEFVSLIGLSGCGKSTIINLLAGYLTPENGKVLFDGQLVESPGPERVVVFQEDAVFPWYTVEQNVGYALEVAGVEPAKLRRNVEEMIALVGLSGFKHFFPKALSGGMKKRVDLARAYAADPRVLLMDEPFGALDAFTRQEMQLQLLKLLEFKKKTVLFVTHDLAEAIFLSDRIILLSGRPGKVKRIFKVPFSKPRIAEMRRSFEFIELQAEIESLLKNEMKNG